MPLSSPQVRRSLSTTKNRVLCLCLCLRLCLCLWMHAYFALMLLFLSARAWCVDRKECRGWVAACTTTPSPGPGGISSTPGENAATRRRKKKLQACTRAPATYRHTCPSHVLRAKHSREGAPTARYKRQPLVVSGQGKGQMVANVDVSIAFSVDRALFCRRSPHCGCLPHGLIVGCFGLESPSIKYIPQQRTVFTLHAACWTRR